VTAGSHVKCIDESLPHLSNRGAEAGKQAPAMFRAVAICPIIRWVGGWIDRDKQISPGVVQTGQREGIDVRKPRGTHSKASSGMARV
jgi:hypothetical protein